jgi:hypothetical protein
MKIIKRTEPKQEELNEFFGKKKKAAEPLPAPPREKAAINRDWNEHYKMLEALRQTGISQFQAGSYFVVDSGLPTALAQEIVQSWLDNYDELALKLHWKK